MLTETVPFELARRLEFAEADAFWDIWDAGPADYARAFRMGRLWLGDVALLISPEISFSHFNQVMGLGLTNPATEETLDGILAIYRASGIKNFHIHHVPPAEPPQLAGWLVARGLRVVSEWDRILRDDEPMPEGEDPPTGMRVEKVGPKKADEWATFVGERYRLPETKPALLALVDRAGWHHYTLRDGEEILAVRSMYLRDGIAWWGVEAPVPGLMTDRFDLDHHLCREMLRDGLAAGAKLFVADIEAPREDMDHDGYRNFGALGFKRAYPRSNYGH